MHDVTINQLDHRPESELSKAEKEERYDYLRLSLKLDEREDLSKEYIQEILATFLKLFDAVSVSDSDFGLTNEATFRIKLKSDTEPILHKSRPLNPAQLEQLDTQLAEWQEAGVIEPAAMVPVRMKEDPKARWTCDYRDLNACTVSDAFPLPDITNNLQQLSGASVFKTLDSAGAFHAIP